ncbi:MAG TPA: hypothetical protein VM639_08875 [Dongiaceae bacterium]|nr:hypothetical protein [Dongiaceae bacterium]
MRNADRINFYLAGLRQPGDNRSRRPGSEDKAGPGGDPGEGLTGEPAGPPGGNARPAAEIPEEIQAKETRAKEVPAIPEVSAIPVKETRTNTAVRSAAGQSFADALRQQLQANMDAELATTLDQAQLRRLLERLDQRRERFGIPFELSPEAARKRHRQLILGLLLAAIIIALQATAVVWLYQRAELLLGRPLSPALLLTATEADLDVVFRPSASAGDIAVLLRELQLRVVDGPDSSGRYVLRPETGTERRHALNALRDRRDLVYSAETAY